MSDWKPKVGDVVCLTQVGIYGGRTIVKRTIQSIGKQIRLGAERRMFHVKDHHGVGPGARLNPCRIRLWTDDDEAKLALQTAKERFCVALSATRYNSALIEQATIEEFTAAFEALEALGRARRDAKP